ncbi:hypothetical protein AB0H12_36265 [Actinosynnema sp. NPDC023794]
MNHALPPNRDVPPRRRAQIRARLEQEVTGGRRAVRFAPLLTAGVAAAAVVALVAVVVPSRQAGVEPAATSDTPVELSTTPSAAPSSTPRQPVIPDLSPARIAEIAKGCAESAGVDGEAVLHQYLTDEVGTLALLYTEHHMLSCTVDGPTMPYNSAMTGGMEVGWLPGELAVDQAASASGGDGGKPEHAGALGYDMAVGRVTSRVAKVVYRQGGRSTEVRPVNGTFVARLAHPSDWQIPDGWDQQAVLQAYDAQGTLLGDWLNVWDRTKCWVRPDGMVVAGARDLDPATCAPAVEWR